MGREPALRKIRIIPFEKTGGDNAGSEVTVTVTGIGEYDGLTAEQKYTIVPRPLGEIIFDTSMFDTSTVEVDYNAAIGNDAYLANVKWLRPTGLLADDTLTLKPSVKDNTRITKPGVYDITAQVTIVDSTSNDVTKNYSFTAPIGRLTVLLRVDVTVEAQEFAYDGEEHAAEFAVVVYGDTDKITFERYAASEEQKVTDVALEAVSVEWEPVFKYDGEAISPDYITGTHFATAQLIIKPLPLEITVTPTASTNLTYDGEKHRLRFGEQRFGNGYHSTGEHSGEAF